MYRIIRLLVLLGAAALFVLPPPAALATQRCLTGVQHLSADPTQAVFTFGAEAGLLPTGTVSIYGDGRVHATGAMHLQNPNLTLDQDTLGGLLKLGEAEAFFQLPAHLSCRTRALDVRIDFISIQTTSGRHAVDLLTVCHKTRFQQLYRILMLTTGASA